MMIYMQDEYPDGWCIYDGDECLFSGLEEDTACIIVSKMNALRAENARLREALAKYANHDNWEGRPMRYGSKEMAYDIWENGRDTHGWETAEAALANETPTV